MNPVKSYIVFLFLLAGFSVSAQPPKTVELARPFTYTVLLDPTTGTTPKQGQQFGPFELLDIQAVPGGKTGEWMVTMIAYQSGIYSLPVSLENDADTSKVYAITVTEPAPDQIQNYLPPKELVFPEPESKTSPLVPILATLLLLAAGIFYWFKNRRKATIVTTTDKPNIVDKLEILKKDWNDGAITATALGESLEIWTKLYAGLAEDYQTNQIIKKMRPILPPNEMEVIIRMLRDCEAWRFGKQDAAKESGLAHIESLTNIVKSNPEFS